MSELGPEVRRFAYDGGGAGLFLVGVIVAPIPVMGLLVAAVLPFRGEDQRLSDNAATALSMVLCLLVTGALGYFLWSAYQVSGYRNGVYTVHEQGLAYRLPGDDVYEIPWADVAEVHEQWRPGRVRWMLPPNLRYAAAIVTHDGSGVRVSGAVRDAPELVATVRSRMVPPVVLPAPARRWAPGQPENVSAVAVAPDGDWLVTAGQGDGTVHIRDAATGAKRATLSGHTRRVFDAVVAPGGGWLATASYDQLVIVWKAGSWERVTTLTGPTEEHQVFWSVAVAPDGSWLAGADTGGRIRIWDTETWGRAATLTGHAVGVTRLAVAPDGSRLVAGDLDGMLWIWDTATWKVRSSVQAHPAYCWGVAVAPDGAWLATTGGWVENGTGDRAVRIWDAATLEPRHTLRGHTSGVSTVAIGPDGSWLASGDHGNTLRVWDARSGQAIAADRLAGKVYTATALPDGSGLAVATEGGLYLLDIEV